MGYLGLGLFIIGAAVLLYIGHRSRAKKPPPEYTSYKEIDDK